MPKNAIYGIKNVDENQTFFFFSGKSGHFAYKNFAVAIFKSYNRCSNFRAGNLKFFVQSLAETPLCGTQNFFLMVERINTCWTNLYFKPFKWPYLVFGLK